MAPAKQDSTQAPVMPQAEITTEAALLKLISENPEAVERIAERFLPTAGRGHGGDPWLEFLKPLVPALAPVLASLAAKLLIPQQAVAEQTNSAETVDALPAAQPPPSFPLEEKYAQAIGQILFGIENGLAPDYVGEGLDMLLEKSPDLAPVLQNFLAVPPAQVVQHLASLSPQAAAVCRVPTAEQWITDLQGYFAGEDEGEQK